MWWCYFLISSISLTQWIKFISMKELGLGYCNESRDSLKKCFGFTYFYNFLLMTYLNLYCAVHYLQYPITTELTIPLFIQGSSHHYDKKGQVTHHLVWPLHVITYISRYCSSAKILASNFFKIALKSNKLLIYKSILRHILTYRATVWWIASDAQRRSLKLVPI